MVNLGLNYRLTDIACALGISQLKKVDIFLAKRIELVKIYNTAFEDFDKIIIPKFDDENTKSGWHLYVIRLNENNKKNRKQVFDELRGAGIGVQVHHTPVHTLTYYKNLGYIGVGLENTEKFYNSVLSLPLYPNLTKEDQNKVIEKVKEIVV
jgi:dTDP-4-amino-4,6-dideoxygalactose transaminase